MRIIFVIMDGAADTGNNTPLKVAKIKNLNFLAKRGRVGLIYTVKKNFAPGSDLGVLSLLGYDPARYYTGRGPLEMFGSNINPKHFLAFRANFATSMNNKIIDRRVGRYLTTREANILADSINKKIKLKYKFVFKPTVEHRGILVFKSKLPYDISNTDIAYKKSGKFSRAETGFSNELRLSHAFSKESQITSSLINQFTLKSREILINHPINKRRIKMGKLPANIILLRDPGNKLPNLPKKKNWIAINSMPLEIGISRLAGFKIIRAKIDTHGRYFKNIDSTTDKALVAIKRYKTSNIYVHFKETDIPGHDGNFKEKVRMLEYIDKKFFSKLKHIKKSLIVVTSDHATPVSLKSHSSDPVPVLVYGKSSDKAKAFNEIECRKGSIKLAHGYYLMKRIHNL